MRHALCVSNATAGLLGIGLALSSRRAEFITTPYTYGASVAPWLMLGNRPVFADIEPETLTLDPEAVRRAATSKTKAILAVDIFGNPCDHAALRRLADELGVWYIADAAQSLGAARDGRPSSALADALVVSFTTGKPAFAGEGGAVLTDSQELYEKLIWFTQHPERQRRELGLHLDNEFAVNARIHPLAAIWASSVFRESLDGVEAHRVACLRVVDLLVNIGVAEQTCRVAEGIEPSFCRTTVTLRHGLTPDAASHQLLTQGFPLRLERAISRPLFPRRVHGPVQGQACQAPELSRCLACLAECRLCRGLLLPGRGTWRQDPAASSEPPAHAAVTTRTA